MLGRCGVRLPACGRKSAAAAPQHRPLVAARAFKRSNPNNPNRQPGGLIDLQTQAPLPPLNADEAAAAAQPRGAPAAPYAPPPPAPNGGGAGAYQAAPPAALPLQPPPPSQQQPQQVAAVPPPQQQQLQQQRPPATPGEQGGAYGAQQGGYINPPPQQSGGYGYDAPGQQQQQQQAGGGWGSPQQQQQPHEQQQPQQAYPPPQQQGGFINPAPPGPGSRGQAAAPQQVPLTPPQQQQQQQGGYMEGGTGGGYMDSGTFMGSTPGGANAWQGGFVNTPARKQYGGSTYNDRSWNNQNNGNFKGFSDDSWSSDTDLLLQSLSNFSDGGLQDAWAEVEEEEPEDLAPKFVNNKRVLVNSEITAPSVRVQGANKEDMGVMSLAAAMEAARELARTMTEQSIASAQMAKRSSDDNREVSTAVRKSIKARVDVVLINEGADPPVVRLVDFSKFKYDAEKTAKQKQKASKGAETKEVRLRPVTEKADYDTKVRQAQKFLSKGARVKLTMTFSGREMRFKDQGKEMMLKLIEELAPVSKMDAPLSLRPSNFSVVLSPLK